MPELRANGVLEVADPKFGVLHSRRWAHEGVRRCVWHPDEARVQQVAALVEQRRYGDALARAEELDLKVHIMARSSRKKRSSAAAAPGGPPAVLPPPPPPAAAAAGGGGLAQASGSPPVCSPQRTSGCWSSAAPPKGQPRLVPLGAAAAAAAGVSTASAAASQSLTPMQRALSAPRPIAAAMPPAATGAQRAVSFPLPAVGRQPAPVPHPWHAAAQQVPPHPGVQHRSNMPSAAAGAPTNQAAAGAPRGSVYDTKVRLGAGLQQPALKRQKHMDLGSSPAAEPAEPAVARATAAASTAAEAVVDGAVSAAGARSQGVEPAGRGHTLESSSSMGPGSSITAAVLAGAVTAAGARGQLGLEASVAERGHTPESSSSVRAGSSITAAVLAGAVTAAGARGQGLEPPTTERGHTPESSSSAGAGSSITTAVLAGAGGQGSEPAAAERGHTPASSSSMGAGSSITAAGDGAGAVPLAAAEEFGLLNSDQVNDLVIVNRMPSSFHRGETLNGVERVAVRLGTSGPVYPAVMKILGGSSARMQLELERLVRVGVPSWRAMGSEVVRVVGAQVDREVTGGITQVRLFMVDKGPECRDLGHLLDAKGAVAVGSNIFLRYFEDDLDDAGKQLHVVDYHGCLVPLQAVLAGLVDTLHVIHEERCMVVRDLRPENVLLPQPSQLGAMNSKEAPSEEVKQLLIDGKLEMAFCDLDAYAKRVRRKRGAQLQQQEPQQEEEEQDKKEEQGKEEEGAAGQSPLALLKTAASGAASMGTTLPGTLNYMAPEVYEVATRKGDTDGAAAGIAASQVAKDTACDIWSLGAVVLTMLVRPATVGSMLKPYSPAYRLLLEPTTRRAVLGRMGVPEELLHVLDRCLEVEPRRRATIKELKQLPVCQPHYTAAQKWLPMIRQLAERMTI